MSTTCLLVEKMQRRILWIPKNIQNVEESVRKNGRETKGKKVSLEYSNIWCLQHDRKLKLKLVKMNIDQCFPNTWYPLHNIMDGKKQIYSYSRKTIYITKCLTALRCWAKIQNYTVFFITKVSQHILAKIELYSTYFRHLVRYRNIRGLDSNCRA